MPGRKWKPGSRNTAYSVKHCRYLPAFLLLQAIAVLARGGLGRDLPRRRLYVAATLVSFCLRIAVRTCCKLGGNSETGH
jgi:hypothetical protein